MSIIGHSFNIIDVASTLGEVEEMNAIDCDSIQYKILLIQRDVKHPTQSQLRREYIVLAQ